MEKKGSAARSKVSEDRFDVPPTTPITFRLVCTTTNSSNKNSVDSCDAESRTQVLMAVVAEAEAGEHSIAGCALPQACKAFSDRHSLTASDFGLHAGDVELLGLLKASRDTQSHAPVVYVLGTALDNEATPRAEGGECRWVPLADIGLAANAKDVSSLEVASSKRPIIPFVDFADAPEVTDSSFTEARRSGRSEEEDAGAEEDTCFCIGDLHGNVHKLYSLYLNAGFYFGHHMNTIDFFFLGDFCDRGANTPLVFDFLLYMVEVRGEERTKLIAGNHDLAFSSFLQLYPTADMDLHGTTERYNTWYATEIVWSEAAFRRGYLQQPPKGEEVPAKKGKKGKSRSWEGHAPATQENRLHTDASSLPGLGRMRSRSETAEMMRFRDCKVVERGDAAYSMHIQGRRWAGNLDIFNASSTFKAYGCAYGDREALLAAMPQDHKDLLATLPWVHEKTYSFGHVVAVHAGMDVNFSLEENLQLLRKRDTDHVYVQPLAGRRKVVQEHPDVVGTETIVVSGHHGWLDVKHPNRIIVDESAGKSFKPLAAVVLPSRVVIRDAPVLCDLEVGE